MALSRPILHIDATSAILNNEVISIDISALYLQGSNYYSYGQKDPRYYEFTLGKSTVFVLSSLTMRGWSDTPLTAASRVSFIM